MDMEILNYLQEREKTFHQRFVRLNNYFTRIPPENKRRKFQTIRVAQECRRRMSDYIKLQVK